MDLHRMIAELQDEKQRLDEAIEALERLSTGGTHHKRRGRPPKWLKADTDKAAGQASLGGSAKKQASSE